VGSFDPRDAAAARISIAEKNSIASFRDSRRVASPADGLMLQEGTFTMSWNWTDGCKPTKHTGIYKTATGYRVRVRALDPRTGTLKGKNREYEGLTLDQAMLMQEQMRAEIRCGGRSEQSRRAKYGDYATSLFERKLGTGELKSAKSKERWVQTQDGHLIPAFGDWYIDQIRRTDIEDWKASQGKRVQAGKLSPHTVNGWLRILLTTLRQALIDLDQEYDPTKGIKPLDTSTWHTYTEEEPNSLTVDEVPRFMAMARALFPQHYAMLALGLATGRRPSELRPLRHKGPTSDILWTDGVLLVRRSETRGEVMETTKTGRRLRIPLPVELMDILRWHVSSLPEGPMRDSELLFPSLVGGYRAPSCLDKPIREIAAAAKIEKNLTPRLMRRTFQDLGRAADVHDFVVRAISGHATSSMQQHYSSVSGDEVRKGLAKVLVLAGLAGAVDESSNSDFRRAS
jgi:integrase